MVEHCHAEEEYQGGQDLAPSDHHLFGTMKEGLGGKHSASDKKVKTAVMNRLKEQSTEFSEVDIHGLIRR